MMGDFETNHPVRARQLKRLTGEVEHLTDELELHKEMWLECEVERIKAQKRNAELEAELDEWKDACDPGIDKEEKNHE
jgi:hypothetical protein